MTDILWKSEDAENATGGKNTKQWNATGVCIDSRNIQKGDLFIAIVGENADGHKYVAQALKDGASAAVVNFVPEDVADDAALLVVQDTMEAMRDMAEYSRNRLKGKVVGVTGSVGKTSTKEMLIQAFEPHGKTCATIGNLNNHYGLPLTLCRIPEDVEYCILEMGMSAPGEISPLSVIAKPDVAIITNVEPVHMEFFESIEGIADAKSEIFDGVSQSGFAIINRDNSQYMRVGAAARQTGIENVKTFAKLQDADYKVEEYIAKDGAGHIKATLKGKKYSFDLGVEGEHQALNSMAILAAVDALGCDLQKSMDALANFSAKDGRGKKHKIVLDGKQITVIDDTYNASPTSVRAAIKTLSALKAENNTRAVFVLGDMYELGKESSNMHSSLAKDFEQNNIDLVFTAGVITDSLYDALPSKIRGKKAENSEKIASIVANDLKDGDIVLVKGSRGMRMENVVNFLLNSK